MVEICCGVVGKLEPAVAPGEPSPCSARLRRMGIRRFKLTAGVGALDPVEEKPRKRQRFGCSASSAELAVELEEAVSSESEPQRGILREDVGHVASCPPRYGVMSVCGRRREMEDAVSVRPDFDRRAHRSDGGRHHFFGVYDGHACSHVAALCRDQMHEFVADEMSKLGPAAPPSTAWSGLMERSFSLMDSLVEARRVDGDRPTACCRCELLAPRCDNVGSTAVVAVVGPTSIVVANCGDSRAVLSRAGVPVPLSSDHKPDRPDELCRIEAAGGRVIYWEGARVLGVLAMSRAIGDGYLKPYVLPEPEVTVRERSDDDEFLILASDGLWDVVTNEMACDVVRLCLRATAPPNRPGAGAGSAAGNRRAACSDAARLLTKLALARQSADNVSVVVVDLRRPGK